MALKINIHILSGKNPLVAFAEASILMSCQIQTMCVKTNIRVNFIPSEVMDEDCIKLLYYHHQDFTMCQKVVEIRMNEGNEDSSKQLEQDLSEVFTEEMFWQLAQLSTDYYVVYGYDYSHCIYNVEIYTSLSVFQKFETFFEKVPPNSYIAFMINEKNDPFIPIFIKAVLRQLGRKPPIDANYDQDIVQTWLSNNEPRGDLFAHSSTLNNVKTEFIIDLDYYLSSYASALRNATSKYAFIYLPRPTTDEYEAMTSDEAYPMHRHNMDKYLSRLKRI